MGMGHGNIGSGVLSFFSSFHSAHILLYISTGGFLLRLLPYHCMGSW